jgi:translocation and assembly module TamB
MTPSAPLPGAPPPPGPIARRTRRRRRGVIALAAGAVLAALVAALIGALRSETLLQAVLDRAVAASGGRLSVEDAGGTLLGPVRAGRIVWHDGPLTVAVDEAAVAIDARALLRGRLRVLEASADHVEVVTEPGGAAATPPASLAPPIGIELVEARIGELVVREAGSESPLRLSGLRASARHARGAWTIDALSLAGPFGTLRAGGRIGDAPPFALDARALLETRALDEPVAFDATARGELAALELEVRTVLRDASVSGRLRLAPFAARPLAGVDLTFAGVDLARFLPGAPGTDLEGRVRGEAPSEASPDAGAPPPLPPLAGTLELRNRRVGTLDADRVPVETASARFDFDGRRLRLDALALVGPPGRLEGGATLRVPPEGGAADDFELRLATGAIDLSRVHASLRPSSLSGTVRVVPEGDGLALDAALADGGLALDARATWAGNVATIARARLSARDGVAELAGTVGTAPPHRVDLAGTVARLDPARFAEVPPGLLNGRWSVRGTLGERAALDARATLADSRWRGLPLAADLAGRWEPDRLAGVAATMRLGTSRIEARGDLGRTGDRLALRIEAPRLAELDARLGGRATVEAELRDALRAPGVGATFEARQLRIDGQLDVRSARGRVDARSPIALAELLARLGIVEPQSVERTRAAARLAGPAPVAPATAPAPLQATLAIDGLRVGDTVLDAAGVELAGDADRHAIALRASRGGRGGRGGRDDRDARRAIDATLRLEGTLAAAPGVDRAGARGGAGVVADAVPRWRGRLVEATNATDPMLRLTAPTELSIAAGEASIGPLELQVDGADGARLQVDAASWRDGRMRLQARLAAVPLRWLGAAAVERGIRVTEPDALRLGARIDLEGEPRPGGALRGTIEAFRESGDVTVDVPALDGGTEPLRSRLQALGARVELADGVLAATLDVRGAAIGTVTGTARAPLAWTGSGLPDLAVPLAGRVELDMPSLAFTRALAGDAWRFDGALQAQLELEGTLAEPRATGRVEGRRLVAEQRELGMRLFDGELSAAVVGDAIDIQSLRFSSGGGSVRMSGSLRPDARSETVLVLDRMPIPLGPGQRLLLSGEARASMRGGELALRGRLVADEGVIELTANDAPRLSRDVVVVRDAGQAARLRGHGGPRPAAADRGPPAGVAEPGRDGAPERGFRIASDLEIDLGERLRVFGAGVDARLEGRLALRGRLPDAPRLFGTVRIVQGTYTGFGQRLEIDRGNLVFSGPVDNPAIDITAYRRFLPVEAGVALTGTARQPRLALISRPDVPDPEKLSWLVLGVGGDASRSGGQGAALQAAAASLLASTDPNFNPGGFASNFGLDVISVRTGQVGGSGGIGAGGTASTSAQDSIVTLGKRLTERLFVSYEQSLRGLQNLLRLQYQVSERLSARLRVGTENAAELLWTYRYD